MIPQQIKNKKGVVISHIVNEASEPNKAWMTNYFNKNFDSVVESILKGKPLKHGFRGLEMKDALIELGIIKNE